MKRFKIRRNKESIGGFALRFERSPSHSFLCSFRLKGTFVMSDPIKKKGEEKERKEGKEGEEKEDEEEGGD